MGKQSLSLISMRSRMLFEWVCVMIYAWFVEVVL
jgi:hypothetical protein